MSNDEIRRSAKLFSMDVDEEANSAVEASIIAASGYDNLSSDQVVEGANGAMILTEAFDLVQFRQSAAWRTIVEGWTNLANDLETKSGDSKLPPSERLSALDQKKGLMQGLALVGSLLAEATERVGRVDSQEKLALGPDGMKVVKESKTLPTEIVSTKKSERPVTAEQLAVNTKSAIAFLSKGANN